MAHPAAAYEPPEISRYSEWHVILDEIAWLAKVVYSDVTMLKRKRFRLDVLFARYLHQNRITVASIRKVFSPSTTPVDDGIWEDMQRGWYNELAFNFPPRISTLGISFSDVTTNAGSSAARFTFPSWQITTAYYSLYFYLRALTRLKQPTFRLQEHKATFRSFKSCALSPLESCVWFYPLNIFATRLGKPSRATPRTLDLPHLKYNYASHPRPPHRSVVETHRHVVSTFRRRARTNNSPYTVLDFMSDFRVWANYLEIEHLLNLRGAGYKAFLDQSLAFLLFFVGGVTELVLLGASSERRFLNRCQRFYSLLAETSEPLKVEYRKLPVAQRLELFTELRLLSRGLKYRHAEDANRVRSAFD